MKKKPKVVVAENAGFCFGVRRAVDMVNEALEKNGNSKVYCWGDLIHNPRVVEGLKEKGLRIIQDPEEVEIKSKFVIRSHGIPCDKLQQVLSKEVEIIDTTCPFVAKARKAAEEFAEKGYQVVIFGDSSHVEVAGINSAINYSGIISEGELSQDDKNKLKKGKVAVLSQTTQKKEKFDEFISKLKGICSEDLQVKNTICMETSYKQDEVRELAKEEDLLLVVGGRKSSNTSKLAEIGRNTGAKTYHLEHFKEFKKEWIKPWMDKIVIAAGASTPDDLIKGLRKRVADSIE
ncbi:MAG: 4-hydroxy-3-methylbut-2-enyl diphosphate reductase [Candidatus Moraniibacteriota bacterium]